MLSSFLVFCTFVSPPPHLWGNTGETFGKTFVLNCAILPRFALHLAVEFSSKTPINTMFSERSIFILVELEGIHAKIWDVVFMGDSGGFLTYV
jgi:hypothetical protein